MVTRILSLLLALGLLIPQAPFCVAMAMGGLDCGSPLTDAPLVAGRDCCCGESETPSDSGAGERLVALAMAGCSCEMQAPSTVKLPSFSSAESHLVSLPLAWPAEVGTVSFAAPESHVGGASVGSVVPRRPLRITLGVRLI